MILEWVILDLFYKVLENPSYNFSCLESSSRSQILQLLATVQIFSQNALTQTIRNSQFWRQFLWIALLTLSMLALVFDVDGWPEHSLSSSDIILLWIDRTIHCFITNAYWSILRSFINCLLIQKQIFKHASFFQKFHFVTQKIATMLVHQGVQCAAWSKLPPFFTQEAN